jgi:hypothetical protein
VVSVPGVFETVLRYLTEAEIPFAQLDGESVLQTKVRGANADWVCQIEASDEDGQVVAYSFVPFEVAEDRRPDVMEFLTRANLGLVVGNFEMDLDSGGVRYKTSLDVMDRPLDDRVFARLFQINLAAMDAYLPGLEEVVADNLTPREAVDAIEGE